MFGHADESVEPVRIKPTEMIEKAGFVLAAPLKAPAGGDFERAAGEKKNGFVCFNKIF